MAPSVSEIKQIFEPLSIQGSQSKYFDHVADDVDWTIMGHSPMSGRYTSKKEFVDATLTVLREKVLTEPLRMKVVNVIAGDGEWAAVEMEAIDAVCKNGESPT